MASLSKFREKPSHDCDGTISYIITSRLVATLCQFKSRIFRLKLSTSSVFHLPLVLLTRIQKNPIN